ncbi:hypothetical protein BGX30_005924 [Mortierella sp. GBA39]|nr:hypothetical protein BGX30_005924 [Mortierella sp. GBA39]
MPGGEDQSGERNRRTDHSPEAGAPAGIVYFADQHRLFMNPPVDFPVQHFLEHQEPGEIPFAYVSIDHVQQLRSHQRGRLAFLEQLDKLVRLLGADMGGFHFFAKDALRPAVQGKGALQQLQPRGGLGPQGTGCADVQPEEDDDREPSYDQIRLRSGQPVKAGL